MKTLRTATRLLGIGLGLGALVLFFFTFLTVQAGSQPVNIAGAELAFGSSLKVGDATVKLAKSMYFAFAFVITLLGTVLIGLSFKFKGAAYAAPAFSLVAAITFTVFVVTNTGNYLDLRQLKFLYSITSKAYQPAFYIAYGLIIATFLVSVLALLVADRVAVLESNGSRKSIVGRVVSFVREYKSEAKKIIWPGPRAVVKNTIIVLIMCLLIGAFIWLADWAFGNGILLLFK